MASDKLKNEINKMQLDISQVTRTTSLLNQNQIQKIWNSTPARYKYQRPAKGGGSWTYIKGSYVRKVLDSVFGFNWDWERTTTDTEIQQWVQMGTRQVIVNGTLVGRVKVDGEWVELRKSATGRADIKFKKNTDIPMDIGNDIKAAETDSLKKCASKMGIGADVYEADEFMEIEIVGSDEAKDSAKATAKKLKAMKNIKVTEVEETK